MCSQEPGNQNNMDMGMQSIRTTKYRRKLPLCCYMDCCGVGFGKVLTVWVFVSFFIFGLLVYWVLVFVWCFVGFFFLFVQLYATKSNVEAKGQALITHYWSWHLLMFPANSILSTNKAHLQLACLRGPEKRFSTFESGKNNKMTYHQKSPHCRVGDRERCICRSVCIINVWLGMLQPKCEMSVFINEADSAGGVMKAGCASWAAGTAFQSKYDPIEGCAWAAGFVIWGKMQV